MRIVLLGTLCVLSASYLFAKVGDLETSMGYPPLPLGVGMLSEAQINNSELKGDETTSSVGESSEFRKEVAEADILFDVRNPLMVVETLQEAVNPNPGDRAEETVDLVDPPKKDDRQLHLIGAMEMMNNAAG